MSDENDKAPEVTGAFSALAAGFGLKRHQQALLLRIAWVVAVTSTLAYILGALTVIGIAAPYAKASDVEQLKQAVVASARVTLSQEIRAQSRVRCTVTDQSVRDSITRYIDSLQTEYEKIAGQRYPEPTCT